MCDVFVIEQIYVKLFLLLFYDSINKKTQCFVLLQCSKMWPKILLTNKNVLVVACKIQQEFFSSLWYQVFALCLNMIVVRFVVLVYSADFVNYLNNKQHDVFWHHKSLGQNL
jgi:hypothetical protein